MSRSQERQQVSLRAEGSALIAPAARVNPRNRPPAAHRHPSPSPARPPSRPPARPLALDASDERLISRRWPPVALCSSTRLHTSPIPFTSDRRSHQAPASGRTAYQATRPAARGTMFSDSCHPFTDASLPLAGRPPTLQLRAVHRLPSHPAPVLRHAAPRRSRSRLLHGDQPYDPSRTVTSQDGYESKTFEIGRPVILAICVDLALKCKHSL